jgi:hypothetical protein
MICRRIKVVWQRTSCAASHHSFITSVVIQHLVSDTLYQACYFRSIQRKTYIMLDKILLIHLTQRAMLTIAITWCQSWSSVLHHKLFQRSSPLKLLHQLEPNLVWIITGVSSLKIVSSDAVHQSTWPLLLKIEHMVKLQVFG